ncbi:MAG TPA: AAA family ATPase [Gemmatimonadaceae bacterium]|nr:AAA family ATPase [Gemmatimonadaceae bacterium]
MPYQETLDDLELLIRSRYPLLVLETEEEERVEAMLKMIASRLSLHYYSWTRTRGLRRGANAGDPFIEGTAEPDKALAEVEHEGAGIFHFPWLGGYMQDAMVASHLRDALSMFGPRRGAIVLSGRPIEIPDALRAHATAMRFPAPDLDEYRQVFEKVVRDNSARAPVKVELSAEERVRLLNNLTGLTLPQAERIITKLLLTDGSLNPKDIGRAVTAKRQLVEQDGLLEYIRAEETMANVAGLAGLKEWLTKRRAMVADPVRAAAFGLSFPKGALLLGVPGCGKSLAAKAVAREWGLPLLKLDPANLYDKYVGNSEKNFKRAMQMAERMAPIVLWIDELEKAFAAGGGEDDGGVSKRVFGTFLSWLQDRKGDVFVVATSNDVAKLPPEFIRKGRFDEVFFVDLPKREARQGIFEIHLRKRKQDPDGFDLPALLAASEGFSGAEIEQAIVSGLYSAFTAGRPLSTEFLCGELKRTRPLSMTMQERLGELRAWAQNRTVSAD